MTQHHLSWASTLAAVGASEQSVGHKNLLHLSMLALSRKYLCINCTTGLNEHSLREKIQDPTLTYVGRSLFLNFDIYKIFITLCLNKVHVLLVAPLPSKVKLPMQ